MHLFYMPEIAQGNTFMTEEESRHASRVLRLGKGDPVIVVDGAGGWYEAVIQDDNVKKCSLDVLSTIRNYNPLPYHLHIGIAPTKSIDRFEWFLEKATEIGISEITPVLCDRSERKIIKIERLEKVIISGMKQSMRAFKPRLNHLTPFKEWITHSRGGTKAIAHCMDLERKFFQELNSEKNLVVAIGPEGDFTEDEIKLSMEAGFQPISLGDSRLRTETAAVLTCSYARFMM